MSAVRAADGRGRLQALRLAPVPGVPTTIERHGPALAGYLLITVLYCWRAVWHIRDRLISDGYDGAFYLWNDWQIPRAFGHVFHLHNPFYTNAIFYPVGIRLGFSTNNWLEAIVSWIMTPFLGFVTTEGVIQLSAVVATGFFAYLLAYHECGCRLPAFVAGAAFTLAPYHFIRLPAHFSLNHMQLLPAGILALLWLYDRPSRTRATIFGVVCACTFLTDEYYAVFLAIATVTIGIYRHRQTFTKTFAIRLVQSSCVAVVPCLPLILEMIREIIQHEQDHPPGWFGADQLSTDVLSWVLPPASHPLWGSHFSAIDARVLNGERIAYPGLVILVLATLALVLGRGQRRWLWALLAGIFAILSCGPFLHVNGHTGAHFTYLDAHFDVPMPAFVFHFLPVLSGLRALGRFSIVAILALDLLAAIALVHLARGRPAWIGRTLSIGALAVVLVELLPGPLPLQPVGGPAAYSLLGREPDGGAVLEIPLQWSGTQLLGDRYPIPRLDYIFSYYATLHGHPITGGLSSRYPAKRFAMLEGIPLFRQILAFEHQPGFSDPPTFTVATLRDLGIRYIVYHRDRPQPALFAYVSAFDLPVFADDGTVVIWRIPS